MTSTSKFAALIVVVAVIAVASAFHSSSHKMFPATAGPRLLRARREPSKELFSSRCFSTVKNVWFQVCKVPDLFNLQDTGTLVGVPDSLQCDVDETNVNTFKKLVQREAPNTLKEIDSGSMRVAYRRSLSDLGTSTATGNTSQPKIAEEFLELAKLFADGCEGSHDNPILVCIPQETIFHREANTFATDERIIKLCDHLRTTDPPVAKSGKIEIYEPPAGVVFLPSFLTNTTSWMFVRPCYNRVLSIVDKAMRSEGVIFTGPQGNGKSWCSMYLFWTFVRRGKTVVYQSAENDKTIIVTGDGTYHEGTLYLDVHKWLTGDSIHIFDCTANGNREPCRSSAFLIVISSRNVNSYKQTARRIKKHYCIPSYTIDELLCVNHLFGVRDDDVISNSRRIGPSIRSVLVINDVNATISELKSLAGDIKIENLLRYKDDGSIANRGNEKDVSASLLRLEVDENMYKDDPDQAYKENNVKWHIASNEVAIILIEAQGTNAFEVTLKLYEAMKISGDFGSARGNILQVIAPSMMRLRVRLARRLVSKESKQEWKQEAEQEAEQDAECMRLDLRNRTTTISPVTTLEEAFESCNDPNYLYTIFGHFPAIDMVSDNFQNVYQLTVAPRHSIHFETIAAICKYVKDTHGPNATVKLTFVVPEIEAKNYIVELPFKLSDGTERTREKLNQLNRTAVENLEQYVLDVNMTKKREALLRGYNRI